MKSQQRIHIGWYVLTDYLAAALSWACFYFIRRLLLGEKLYIKVGLQHDIRFWLGVLFIPLGWLTLFMLVGSYRQSLYKKSRLFELGTTFICTLIGSVVLFFSFVLDDARN